MAKIVIKKYKVGNKTFSTYERAKSHYLSEYDRIGNRTPYIEEMKGIKRHTKKKR